MATLYVLGAVLLWSGITIEVMQPGSHTTHQTEKIQCPALNHTYTKPHLHSTTLRIELAQHSPLLTSTGVMHDLVMQTEAMTVPLAHQIAGRLVLQGL